MKSIKIGDVAIGPEHPPYIIAELSANHNGNFDNALALIKAAKQAGASAVKLQTYTADTITIKSDRPEFMIHGGLWDGKSLYDLYEWAHTPWEWQQPLFEYARQLGISIFSSPFDDTAVDMLESLGAPAYKIASFEAIDIPLIQRVAATKKPMIISTGMTSVDEISEAIETARSGGCDQLAILHCVSGYPASAEDYNLRTLLDMQKRFGVLVGLSDHTLDNATAIASIALGACIVEKHVTLDRSGGGPDDSFSLEPQDLEALVTMSNTAWSALGTADYARSAAEKANTQFRRSLYFVRDVPAGAVVTAADVRSIRPGNGLPPKSLAGLIGALAIVDIASATPASWDLVKVTN